MAEEHNKTKKPSEQFLNLKTAVCDVIEVVAAAGVVASRDTIWFQRDAARADLQPQHQRMFRQAEAPKKRTNDPKANSLMKPLMVVACVIQEFLYQTRNR